MNLAEQAFSMVGGAVISGIVGLMASLFRDRLRERATRRELAGSLLAEIDGLVDYLGRIRLLETVRNARKAAGHDGGMPDDTPDFFRRSLGVVRPVPLAIPSLDLLSDPVPAQLAEFSTRLSASLELVNLASEPTRDWLDARSKGSTSQEVRSQAEEALERAELELDALYEVHGELRQHLRALSRSGDPQRSRMLVNRIRQLGGRVEAD